MAMAQGLVPAAAVLHIHMALLLGLAAVASIPARAASVGVCYGMSGNNLPPASTVVGMLRDNGFTSVRLYAPDAAALAALAGTGIGVVVGAPNDVVPSLSTNPSFAASWVRDNIAAHPYVSFKYLSVGNEISGENTQHLVPAMENVLAALNAAGLGMGVQVTTAISQATIAVHTPPSAGAFAEDCKPFLLPVLQFLARTGAPLLANLYPYFAYTYRAAGDIDVSFALFTAEYQGGPVVQDGEYAYHNMFDATVDAVHAAMEKLLGGESGGVNLVVSETGWPSAGDADEAGATPANAARYNGNLMRMMKEGKGTPAAGEGEPLQVYVFALFNENLKPGPASERHYGLFRPDGTPAYDVGVKAPAIGGGKGTDEEGGGGGGLVVGEGPAGAGAGSDGGGAGGMDSTGFYTISAATRKVSAITVIC